MTNLCFVLSEVNTEYLNAYSQYALCNFNGASYPMQIALLCQGMLIISVMNLWYIFMLFGAMSIISFMPISPFPFLLCKNFWTLWDWAYVANCYFQLFFKTFVLLFRLLGFWVSVSSMGSLRRAAPEAPSCTSRLARMRQSCGCRRGQVRPPLTPWQCHSGPGLPGFFFLQFSRNCQILDKWVPIIRKNSRK